MTEDIDISNQFMKEKKSLLEVITVLQLFSNKDHNKVIVFRRQFIFVEILLTILDIFFKCPQPRLGPGKFIQRVSDPKF